MAKKMVEDGKVMVRLRLRRIGNYRYGYREVITKVDGAEVRKEEYLGRYDPASDSFLKVRKGETEMIKYRYRRDPLKKGVYYAGEVWNSEPFEAECASCRRLDADTGICRVTGEYVEDLSDYCEAFLPPTPVKAGPESPPST